MEMRMNVEPDQSLEVWGWFCSGCADVFWSYARGQFSARYGLVVKIGGFVVFVTRDGDKHFVVAVPPYPSPPPGVAWRAAKIYEAMRESSPVSLTGHVCDGSCEEHWLLCPYPAP